MYPHKHEVCNNMPYMKCRSCGVVIECDDLSEAEQRARIHMQELKPTIHNAEWLLVDDDDDTDNVSIETPY